MIYKKLQFLGKLQNNVKKRKTHHNKLSFSFKAIYLKSIFYDEYTSFLSNCQICQMSKNERERGMKMKNKILEERNGEERGLMNKKGNPLDVNHKLVSKREKTDKKKTSQVAKELSSKYHKTEAFIQLLTKICLQFEVTDYETEIEKFLIKSSK